MNLAFQLGFLGLESLGGVLATILGFGALVFVHEFGHFLAAKWVGVRVEVFSLGFGPRIFGFVRGPTDYRIAALPLGGYVKMLGQDDSDPNTPRTTAPDDFRNQSVAGRLLILIAGVAMNTVFALLAFVVAFALGVDFTAAEVGTVHPNSAASRAHLLGSPEPGVLQGLQAGDQILAIGGSPILAFEDISTTVALSSGKIEIVVARPAPTGKVERLALEATPTRQEGDPFPKLGIEPGYVIDGFADDSPAPLAGLKEGDQIVDVAPVGSPISDVARAPLSDVDDNSVVLDSPGVPLQVVVQRRDYDDDGRPIERAPVRRTIVVTPLSRPRYDVGIVFADDARVRAVPQDSPARTLLEPDDTIVSINDRPVGVGNLSEAVRAAGNAHSHPGDTRSEPITIVFERKGARHDGQVQLERRPNDEGWLLGIEFAADKVASVVPGSPASRIGIEPGDHITTTWNDTVSGVKYRGAHRSGRDDVRLLAFKKKDQPWKIGWEKPDGRELSAEIAAVPAPGFFGQLGIHPGPRPIFLRRSPLGACSLGFDRTIRMFQHLVLTIRQLISRQVATSELGGPIQIATITYKIAQKGSGKLLYFLAILSVNLAVLNILPIPVLDGGHIFLLVIEKLKGRPLSDDVMRYVQYGGLVFVIGLMAYVTFNDIKRFFEERPERESMSNYADASDLEGFLGHEVVLDTRGDILYVGTFVRVLENFYELKDADVHDIVSGRTSKELYVMEARKHGIKKNRAHVHVRKLEIVSISRLSDVIEYQLLRTVLQVVRAPLAATAIADGLTGFLLATVRTAVPAGPYAGTFPHERVQGAGPVLVVAGASTALYWGGMALNDFFDRERDRTIHPYRPLPSGRFPSQLALALGLLLLLVGIGIASLAGVKAAVLATGVACAVLAYDGLLKRIRLGGCLAMAACRSGNVLLGAAIGFSQLAMGPEGAAPFYLVHAAAIGLYVFSLTLLSTFENEDAPVTGLLIGFAGVLGAPVVLAWKLPDRASLPFFGAHVALVVVLIVMMRKGSRAAGPGTTRWLLRGLLLLDAGALAGTGIGYRWILGVLGLLVPNVLGAWLLFRKKPVQP